MSFWLHVTIQVLQNSRGAVEFQPVANSPLRSPVSSNCLFGKVNDGGGTVDLDRGIIRSCHYDRFFPPETQLPIFTNVGCTKSYRGRGDMKQLYHYPKVDTVQVPPNTCGDSEVQFASEQSLINDEDAQLYSMLTAAMETDLVEYQKIASAVNNSVIRETQSPTFTPTMSCSGNALALTEDVSHAPVAAASSPPTSAGSKNQGSTTPDVTTSPLPSTEEMTMDLSFEDVTFTKQPGQLFDEKEKTSKLIRLSEGGKDDNNYRLYTRPTPIPPWAGRPPLAPTPSEMQSNVNSNTNDNNERKTGRPNSFDNASSYPFGLAPSTELTDNQSLLAAMPFPEIAQVISSRGFIVLPRDATDDFLASHGLVRTSLLSEAELARLGIPRPTTTFHSPLRTHTSAVAVTTPGHAGHARNASNSNSNSNSTSTNTSTNTNRNNSVSPSSSPPCKRNASAVSLYQTPQLARQTSKKRKFSKTSTLDITGRPEGFPAPSGLSNAIVNSILRQQEAKRGRNYARQGGYPAGIDRFIWEKNGQQYHSIDLVLSRRPLILITSAL
ncbi:hypothetical protein SODALDRAFT_379453 [Sodiomyces alkalinus F11]|uniref:Uncharacterized protein n=1 Tax=Sodiomyces alkalinus (strain CBS 110278 / VKM F-3762 / F11) TaxID=1314773 RepID=A0A3N2PUT1_SODAK|nr:hypothetical protein SODALDRAFT_379453 [Sodiomyces alkalinus F11]ROT38259.1 hypothetical protein SODALDRAFT_379453 [Sodiomyces alkalinus F11]